jgi:acyl-CoA synthetase (AMP-forming)/AMP-acid ligase II
VTTVFSAFEQTASAHPRRPFLLAYPQRTELSYGTALERVAAVAARYRARGYGKGHRVGLRLPNCPEFLLHFLALNSLGASVVPLNPDYRSAELDYVLAHSEAGAVIDASTLDDPPPAGKACDAEECALLYTSGTTGKPKGCLLSNFYFLNVGRRYLAEGGLCALRDGEERLITPLPLFHMNALAVSTTAMIFTAGCIVQLDRFHPKTWWRDVADSPRSCTTLG